MIPAELAAIRARVEAVKHYAEIALADALTRYEDAAERFYRETGFMAPGKSEPLGWGGGEAHDAERRSRWEAWLMEDTRRRSVVEVELADDVARLTAEVERLSAMVPRWRRTDYSDGSLVLWLVVGESAPNSVNGTMVFGSRGGEACPTYDFIMRPDLPTACAAVCRRLGLPYIAPPETP